MMNNGIGATPEQLGVRPAPALGQQFLIHAFAWMFAGVLLTAAVAFAVQDSPTLTNFAAPNGTRSSSSASSRWSS